MATTNRLTADDIKSMYSQMQQSTEQGIDYGVQSSVNELKRAQEDAQAGFQKQQNQVSINEAQARDQHALYAAARGDRGGITARQYDNIANTASNNRRAILEQQQKLATDTERQIADLRAKGQFEKANAILQIAQQQLAQLFELQQYEEQREQAEKQLAMSEAGLTGVYNGQQTLAAKQYANQLAMSEAALTGMYNGEQTLAAKQYEAELAASEKKWAYQVAMEYIQSGIMPTSDVLAAAGLDSGTAQQMANVYKAALSAKKSGSSGGTGNSNTSSKYTLNSNKTGTGTTAEVYGPQQSNTLKTSKGTTVSNTTTLSTNKNSNTTTKNSTTKGYFENNKSYNVLAANIKNREVSGYSKEYLLDLVENEYNKGNITQAESILLIRKIRAN